MFEQCTTLAQLNAERIKACTEDADIVTVNNAYNARRQEILSMRKAYKVISFTHVTPMKQNPFCSIPLVGRSNTLNTLIMNEKGFLY